MKLYALKDRLLDYFMQPFAAPGDKEVMAAVSATVNNLGGLDTNAVSAAPHHYEIWRLAEVDDQGHVTSSREFLADCSALVRKKPVSNDETGQKVTPLELVSPGHAEPRRQQS